MSWWRGSSGSRCANSEWRIANRERDGTRWNRSIRYSLFAIRYSLLPSRLPLRHAHHQAVELVRHLDLTGEPRARPHVVAEVQHVLFHWRGLAGALAPGVIDIDVAGRAGTGAAALGLDAGHVVLDGSFHHGRAELAFDLIDSSVRADKGDLGHGRTR